MEYPPTSVDAVVGMQNEAAANGTVQTPEFVAARTKTISNIGSKAAVSIQSYRDITKDGHRFIVPENIAADGRILFAHPQLAHLSPQNIVFPPNPDHEGLTFDNYQLGVSLLSLANQKPTASYIQQGPKGVTYNHSTVQSDINALRNNLVASRVQSTLPDVITGLTNADPAARTRVKTAATQLNETDINTRVIGAAPVSIIESDHDHLIEHSAPPVVVVTPPPVVVVNKPVPVVVSQPVTSGPVVLGIYDQPLDGYT